MQPLSVYVQCGMACSYEYNHSPNTHIILRWLLEHTIRLSDRGLDSPRLLSPPPYRGEEEAEEEEDEEAEAE